MNYQDIRRPPPARKADDDLANEPPTKALDPRFNQGCPTSQADIPAENEIAALKQAAPTAAHIVDELAFEFLAEAASSAIQHTNQTIKACDDRNRRAAKMHACQASRAVKSMLETVAELVRDPVRA